MLGPVGRSNRLGTTPSPGLDHGQLRLVNKFSKSVVDRRVAARSALPPSQECLESGEYDFAVQGTRNKHRLKFSCTLAYRALEMGSAN
jgi:hypothetical protein